MTWDGLGYTGGGQGIAGIAVIGRRRTPKAGGGATVCHGRLPKGPRSRSGSLDADTRDSAFQAEPRAKLGSAGMRWDIEGGDRGSPESPRSRGIAVIGKPNR